MVKNLKVTSMYSFVYRTNVFRLGYIFVSDFITNLYERSAKIWHIISKCAAIIWIFYLSLYNICKNKKNGLLSAVPYIFFWLFQILSGIVADQLMEKFEFQTNTVRRLFNILGFIIPMFTLIGL